MVELCVRAGHPEPEFLHQAGAVCVRFLPSGYIAPHRIAHDLTQRQRKLLQALAGSEARPFGELRAQVAPDTPERTLRDDLSHLKRLGLIIGLLTGHRSRAEAGKGGKKVSRLLHVGQKKPKAGGAK